MTFGADLIAGFPTETEAHFADSLGLVEECGLTWLHVFPYSARQGTPAARMPQLAGPVRKQRAARLRAAGEQAVAALPRLPRRARRTQCWSRKPGFGRTEGFAEVRLDPALPEGSIAARTITGVAGGHLLAEAA